MSGGPSERETVTMLVASSRLGLTPTSTSRVRQLLDDPDEPLDGPEVLDRGRSHLRLVWEDTIALQIERRRVARERRRPADLHVSVARLWRRVDELADTQRDAAGSDRSRIADLEQQVRRLQFDKEKAQAAADALRDAWDKHAEADELRRKAAEMDAEAMTALRRAEKARDDAT